MKKIPAIVLFLVTLPSFFVQLGAQELTALDRYVAKPDPNYTFTHYHTEDNFDYTSFFLSMVSQQWRTSNEVDRALWEHELIIVVPPAPHPYNPDTAVLFIDGGNNDGTLKMDTPDQVLVAAIVLGSVVAIVKQVPNQPLQFTDEAGVARTEDEILAYSLDKYLDTGDEEWPVHLAMTKAAIRAMDSIQTFLQSKSQSIKDFIVVGGSKRGWTTWLTAAVDPRIKAIAPVSIDLLKMEQQFVNHWEAYGFYTPAIKDYVEFDLPCRIQTPKGQAVLPIIDPYEYRNRYTMPKLIVNSAGDQFFAPDSSQFYYQELPSPKRLRYSVNTDHAQDMNVVFTILSWVDDVLDDTTSPKYSWSLEEEGVVRVQTTTTPQKVLLWQATNPLARDFRLESLGPAWTQTELKDTGKGVYIGTVPQPQQGWTAFTIELTFEESDPLKPQQVYTTDVYITPNDFPFAGQACHSNAPP